MPKLTSLKNSVFNIKNKDEFNELAMSIFKYQYKHNGIYKMFVNFLNIDPYSINNYENIPFLPIEFFKNHEITTESTHSETIFTSSGTTGINTSKHIVSDIKLYERSFKTAFKLFFGDIAEYTVIALLPSYLERNGSSLVYMAQKLILESRCKESGFYLDEHEKLNTLLCKLKNESRKVILLGVTYALLDLAEKYPINFPELILMETGGMKGKRKEMVRDELHEILKKRMGVDRIYSEYGMTELLSQAYSKGDGKFFCPPWMKVLIRDTNDPQTILPTGKSGGINVIDLANIQSCSFIATQDLGKSNSNGSFEILGRFDNSDIRGCNLLVQ